MDNNKLTKRERYLEKKKIKEEKKLRLQRKQKTKKIIIVSFIIAISAIIIIFSTTKIVNKINQGTPKMVISETEFDAGEISMADGPLIHSYEIKNDGDGDLKISAIETSCMCTTSVLKVDDKTSPEFGMHGNPVGWSEKIAPGQTAELEVTFDPAFHGPSGTGPVTRAVVFETNDLKNKEAEVKLSAHVVK